MKEIPYKCSKTFHQKQNACQGVKATEDANSGHGSNLPIMEDMEQGLGSNVS